MKHHMNEAQLALYLRGDLSGADHRSMAQHVEGCPECQSTLQELSQSYELLVGSFDEPTPAELSAVRSAVAARIQTRRRGAAWRVWTLAASAVVAVIVVSVDWRPQTQVPPPPVAPAVPTLAVRISPPPVAVRIKPRRHVAPATRTVTLLTTAEQPAFLKINTPDPNVVILWQLNDNEKAETP
jgi:anti-sigma factor RsiW